MKTESYGAISPLAQKAGMMRGRSTTAVTATTVTATTTKSSRRSRRRRRRTRTRTRRRRRRTTTTTMNTILPHHLKRSGSIDPSKYSCWKVLLTVTSHRKGQEVCHNISWTGIFVFIHSVQRTMHVSDEKSK